MDILHDLLMAPIMIKSSRIDAQNHHEIAVDYENDLFMRHLIQILEMTVRKIHGNPVQFLMWFFLGPLFNIPLSTTYQQKVDHDVYLTYTDDTIKVALVMNDRSIKKLRLIFRVINIRQNIEYRPIETSMKWSDIEELVDKWNLAQTTVQTSIVDS